MDAQMKTVSTLIPHFSLVYDGVFDSSRWNGGAKMNIPLQKHQLGRVFAELEEKYLYSKATSSFLEKLGEAYETGLPQVMKVWVGVTKLAHISVNVTICFPIEIPTPNY